MPLNITPAAGAAPQQPGGPAKYVPTRNSPGMGPNTAPIDERAMPPGTKPAAEAGAAGEVDQEQPGAEGEGEEGKGPDSWRFAKLAEKDRIARDRLNAARAAEGRLKSREEELGQREAALRAEEQKRATWRSNPAQLLRDHGFVPEAALQFMLNGEKLTPEQELARQVDQRLEQERTSRTEELERIRQEQLQREQERDDGAREQERRDLAAQEQAAVDELHADIGDVVSGDAKSFPVLQKAGARAEAAVFQRLNEISDKQLRETGRRPPVTTKMIERAAADVEAAARKELQETLSDQHVAEALGVGRPAPRQVRTLTTDLPIRQSVKDQAELQRQETEAEKRERVKRMIEDGWTRKRPQ
jgi:hypothetical protein